MNCAIVKKASMKLVVAAGSYERILYGIDVSIPSTSSVKKEVSVKESFAMAAHTGSIRSLASCPRYLVSGSTDETIR